jgi:hypothetical protein
LRVEARDEVIQRELVDGNLCSCLELGPENISTRKLDMELASVLGVRAVAILVPHQTANDNLSDGLPFRVLGEVAVMAGNDDKRLFGCYWVVKPKGFNRVNAQ